MAWLPSEAGSWGTISSSLRPSTPVPARRQSQRTLSEVFFNREGCHIPQTPAETSVLRGENFTALNAPTKALKNARIGRPFRQRRTMG